MYPCTFTCSLSLHCCHNLGTGRFGVKLAPVCLVLFFIVNPSNTCLRKTFFVPRSTDTLAPHFGFPSYFLYFVGFGTPTHNLEPRGWKNVVSTCQRCLSALLCLKGPLEWRKGKLLARRQSAQRRRFHHSDICSPKHQSDGAGTMAASGLYVRPLSHGQICLPAETLNSSSSLLCFFSVEADGSWAFLDNLR